MGSVMMTMTEKKAKHQIVYNYLIEGIKQGQFSPDQKLPSERALAEKFCVNLATIRRAFKELVMTGVVEKRVGDGTYLKEQEVGGAVSGLPIINILLSNYDGPVHREFIEAVFMAAQHRHFVPQIIKISLTDYLPTVRMINPEHPLLVLAEEVLISGPLRKMLRQTFHRAVLIGARMDTENVISIIGDDNYGIRMLIEHLREHGHSRIALLANNLKHPVEKSQVAIWRSLLEQDYDESLFINAGVPSAGQPMDYAYNVIRERLAGDNFTALISLNDELAIGAMAACRDAGKRIPADISVASIGNTALCRYSYPRLSCIDPNIAGHVNIGIDLLLSCADRQDDNLRIVRPVLVKRDSIAPIKASLT